MPSPKATRREPPNRASQVLRMINDVITRKKLRPKGRGRDAYIVLWTE